MNYSNSVFLDYFFNGQRGWGQQDQGQQKPACGPIMIKNDGQELVESNYWDHVYARNNFVYLSTNAGCIRLLIPDTFPLHELKGTKGVAITRGRCFGRDALEVLFDDGSDYPYSIQVGTEQCDRVAPVSAIPQRVRFQVVMKGPRVVAEYECFYRGAPTLPCLAPWNEM